MDKKAGFNTAYLLFALLAILQRPSEDRSLVSRGELMNRIAVLMGGRAAEKLVFDEREISALTADLRRPG